MSNIVQEFIHAMEKAGCAPENPNEINPTGEDSYFKLLGDKKGRRGGYCLTELPDGFAYGNFCSFKSGERGKWNSSQSNKKLTKEEKEIFLNRIKQAEKDREARQAKIHEDKSKESVLTWENAIDCIKHPYLLKKGVKSYGLKSKNDNLIIPMWSDDKIWSYQSISTDGEKLFLIGGKKKGCYYKIGIETDVICIGEGYSTCASIHEATGFCTFVAFDCGNLKPVAQEVRKKFPKNLIIVCCDNDQF